MSDQNLIHIRPNAKLILRKIRIAACILVSLLHVWGCALLPPTASETLTIDNLPPLLVKGGPNINPAADPDAIADTDILALDGRMVQILDEQIAGIKGPQRRLEALLDVIHANGLFNHTDDRHRTRTASETAEYGAGNCLSYSAAFIAMARHVGLDARFQDIPTYPNWDRHLNTLFYNKHIGAYVRLNIQMKYEIDFHHRDDLHYLETEIEDRSIPDIRAFAQYYNNIGSEHLAEGNLATAFRYIVKSLRTDPDLSYVWSNLGSVYNRSGQHEESERAFLQAVAINPSEYTAMSNLTRLYAKLGRDEDAEYFRKRVKYFRNRNPYYHYAIGEKAFHEGQYAETVKHLRKAIRRKEDAHQFHFALARAYLKLGAAEKAEKSLERARDYSPNEKTLRYYSRMWKALSEESYLSN